MIKRGKHLIKNHMTLEYNFSGIRIQESSLTPVDWNLTVNLAALEKKGKTREDIEHEVGITYQKIYFWLDANLPSIIMVNACNEDDMYIANLSSNIMMYCPGNPGDELIIRLIHAKITKLAHSTVIVSEICLKGNDTSLGYTFDCSDGNYELPSTTVEYYTEGVTRDTIPWWHRDDGFCFEFVRPADTELSDAELFKNIQDPMIEFNKIIEEMSDIPIVSIKEPAKIVQVERWKPKTV